MIIRIKKAQIINANFCDLYKTIKEKKEIRKNILNDVSFQWTQKGFHLIYKLNCLVIFTVILFRTNPHWVSNSFYCFVHE